MYFCILTGAHGRGRGLRTRLGNPSSMCLSLSQSPTPLPQPGRKRVWVPDEQDAYVEAEIKSEATGGRVNVETKDQKVWLPSSGIISSASSGAARWRTG